MMQDILTWRNPFCHEKYIPVLPARYIYYFL